MAGTRTAPAFSGAATLRLITLHLIDTSGDTHSVSDYFPVATTDAQIETYADNYQAASQASVYKISDSFVYEGDADPDNAETDQRNSVKQGVNMLMKNVAALRSTTPRLVAPIPAVMQGNQDIPLLSSAELTAVITQWLAINPGFNLVSAQYTERRDRANNPRVK